MTTSCTRDRWPLRLLGVLALLCVLAFSAACGSDDESADAGSSSDGTASGDGGGDEEVTLRLGYFPNVTHAPAIVGLEKGLIEEQLGDDVKLELTTFNSGTEATEALFAGAIDASFIGPNPAINAWAQSEGEAIKIVSGSTSGGALFVTDPEITEVDQLEGTTLATPSLGNTQDVALRAWLEEQGIEADTEGGGDLSITPLENADTLAAFQAGTIDGAWVPEPWGTRLIQDGGGEVFLDEAELWPDGQFVTTHLIVSQEFLADHPDTVKGLVAGVVEAVDFIEANPDEAKTLTNAGIEAVTGKPLPQEIIDAAWENLTFTVDPIAASLAKSSADAEAVGLQDPVDLEGIYDLTFLNEILADQGDEAVSGL
jgi:NitT/TauT family transport system substrate-binding protein